MQHRPCNNTLQHRRATTSRNPALATDPTINNTSCCNRTSPIERHGRRLHTGEGVSTNAAFSRLCSRIRTVMRRGGSRAAVGNPAASADIRVTEILQAIFANLNHVILVIDGHSRTVVQANDAVERVFGYRPEEVIGTTTESLHIDTEHFTEFATRGNPVLDREETFIVEYPMRRRDGSHFPAEIRVSAVELPGTGLSGVVAIIQDLSEQKRNEELQRTSRQKLGLVLEKVPSILWTTDLHRHFTSFQGRDAAELLPEASAIERLTPHDIFQHSRRADSDAGTLPRCIHGAIEGQSCSCIATAGGRTYTIRVDPLREPGGTISGTIGVAHDVTERERLLNEKREREKELQCLNRLSQLTIEHGVQSDRLYEEVVNGVADGFQYPKATHCRLILPSNEYRSAHFRETVNAHVRELSVHGNAYGRLEVYIDTQLFEETAPPFLREEETLLDVIVERIGAAIEQRIDNEALLESSRKFTAVFESALDAIALIDDDRRYIDLNSAALELTGLSSEEARGRSISEIMHEADPDSFNTRWQQFKERGWSTGEFRLVRSDGQIRTVEFYAVANVLPGVHLSVNRDITDRKQYEQQLEAAVAERESLIREIHHRVKNNLQLVSSMLSLQMQTLDRTDRRVLDTARARVNALALAYEQLVRSDRVAPAELNSYLGRLTASLSELNERVSIDLDATSVTVDIDRAIPIALIVNELVTNSMEHGFPENRSGSVRITVGAVGDEEIVLTVADNGCGLPPRENAGDRTGLGLQLVRSFAEQLGGSMSINSDGGVRVELRVPR